MEHSASTRPPVSLIVPFAGESEEAARLLQALDGVRCKPGDEIIVVDNSISACLQRGTAEIRVVRAAAAESSYYARNMGAEVAGSDWLLFVDADTQPLSDLLDRYFDPPPGERTGIVAGEVIAAPDQSSLPARHMATRGHLSVKPLLARRPRPTGVTANLLVRRSVWQHLGGFHPVRSGGDFEFCWRAQEVGWRLEYRPEALVRHRHAETVRGTLRKARRYGPGQSWLNRRYPGSAPPPRPVRATARAVAGIAVWVLALRLERAAFKALDALWTWAYAVGYFSGDNRPRVSAPARPMRAMPRLRSVIIVVETAVEMDRPEVSQRVVERTGGDSNVGVLAARRPVRTDPATLAELDRRGASMVFVEELPATLRLRALASAILSHPMRLGRAVGAARSAPPRPLLSAIADVAGVAAGLRELPVGSIAVCLSDWEHGAAVACALAGDEPKGAER